MKISLKGRFFAENELEAILSLLKLLDKGEQDRLLHFLDSPYFNTDKALVPLYERILTVYRRKKEKGLKQSKITGQPLIKALQWEDLQEATIRAKLLDLLRKLPDLIGTFIEHDEIVQNRRLGYRVRTLAMKKKKDANLFWEAAASFEEVIKQDPASIMRYHDSWWLYHQSFFHQYTRQYDEEANSCLANAAEDACHFYQLVMLRYYCEILNRRKILVNKQQFAHLEARMKALIEEDSDHLLVAAYSKLAKLLENRDRTDKYEELKAYFQQHQKQFAIADQLVIIKIVFNIWIKHYETAKEGAPEELFFWADTGVRSGAFLMEGSLSDREFLNIVMAAGIADQLEFLETFIEDYKPHLEEHCREQAYQMGRISLYFFRKETDKVLRSLQEHFGKGKHIDAIYALRAKVIYILVYLACCIRDEPVITPDSEKDGHDLFSPSCEAFIKYVQRIGFLDDARKVPFLRFAAWSQKVYQFHSGTQEDKTAEARAELIEHIRHEDALVARYVLIRLAAYGE